MNKLPFMPIQDKYNQTKLRGFLIILVEINTSHTLVSVVIKRRLHPRRHVEISRDFVDFLNLPK